MVNDIISRHENEGLTKNSNEKRRIGNNVSILLTSKEKQELLNLLNNDQYVICSGIARVLKANKHFSPGWEMIGRGVIVYIKDYARKLYTLMLYCLPTKRCIWEHILYTNFMPVFGFERIDTLEFEGDGTIYCINFSHHAEAQLFYTLFKKKFDRDNICEFNENNLSQLLSGQLSNPLFNSSSSCNVDRIGNEKPLPKITKNDKKNKGKIKKFDISGPTNFSHLVHIGWKKDEVIPKIDNKNNPKTNIDQSVKDLLKAAGYDYTKMKEKDLQFAKTFVEEYEKRKSSNKIMSINNNNNNASLATPSSSNVKFENVNLEMVPTISTKQQSTITRRTPPPPPPLPTILTKNRISHNDNKVLTSRNLDKSNKSFKDMDKSSNLMEQIKQGKVLNHVDQETKLHYEALRRTMNERRQKLSESDPSSSSTTDDWE